MRAAAIARSTLLRREATGEDDASLSAPMSIEQICEHSAQSKARPFRRARRRRGCRRLLHRRLEMRASKSVSVTALRYAHRSPDLSSPVAAFTAATVLGVGSAVQLHDVEAARAPRCAQSGPSADHQRRQRAEHRSTPSKQ